MASQIVLKSLVLLAALAGAARAVCTCGGDAAAAFETFALLLGRTAPRRCVSLGRMLLLLGTARRPDQLPHSFQRRRRPSARIGYQHCSKKLSHGQRVLTAGQPLLADKPDGPGAGGTRGGARQSRTDSP
ncbi:hypothetical protein AALO_G00251450 [Alosa alosa]|uniref:Secreted protein n=1 Tax=Alosa alosa TaxID=278164 RepID=A0AAV6FNW6_9TELE|nr:hypothetical protein AALO_G00251450 [Alosa alosa]